MLDLLRRKAQSPYLQATVLIIIIVFVFWGVGANQSGVRNAVATVNGEPITLGEYDQAYKRTIDQYSSQFGGSLPKGFLEALDVKHQVLNQLIQRSLLLQGGAEMGLYVSNQEIQNAIKEMTVFQNNGVFDVSRYKEVLKGSRLTPTKFENGLRTDLLATKVASAVSGFGRVVPFELDDRFGFDNDEYRLDYAVFKTEDFTDQVTVTDEALAEYFDQNKEKYKTAPQVKLKYLSFLYDQEKENITIPENEINDYYTKNQSEFGQPEKRQASHILLKTTPQDHDTRKAEIDNILTRIKDGEDFAALAKEFSEDGSASRGGDLGFFSRAQMVKPFADAAFSLQKGEISDVVTTQFGYHIIKLVDIQPADIKPLAEVKSVIEDKLKQQLARNAAFEKANEAYEKIIFAGSLAKYSEKFEASLSETDFFPQASPPETLRNDPSLISTAFTLKKGELSSLLDTPEGYFILFVDDVKDPEIPEMATVKEKVEKDFIAEQAREMAQKAANETLAAIREGADFTEKLQEAGQPVLISNYFSRNNRQANNLPADLLDKAFNLTADSPYPEETVASGNSFYLYRFKDKKEANKEDNQSQEAFQAKLTKEKQSAIMDAWINHLMKQAKVTVNEKYLN
ncbi:MAG: SurA N-terminal domain-containing protein [Desulfobulbaceae bacterium]|nr:SurA N-terminal domain-containing protein [Desulfobulbaceae bacterium]